MIGFVLALAVVAPPKPHIVPKPIPYGAARRAEMAAYAQRHYGMHTWKLRPRAIVEHVTATGSFASAYATFASDRPDVEFGELPGTCAHFVVDRNGTIYQLVATDVMCRHTVGLNWAAIGIEHVGLSDAQVLGDRAQMRSSLALTLWLMWRYRIPLADVIGHNESLTSPLRRERVRSWRCRTHADWKRADMDIYRRRLRSLAARYGEALGPAPRGVIVAACR